MAEASQITIIVNAWNVVNMCTTLQAHIYMQLALVENRIIFTL